MVQKIQRLLISYFQSFDTTDKGFSRKKIIATFIVLISVYLEIQLCTEDLLTTVLITNFGFVATLLGIGAWVNMKNNAPTVTATKTTVDTQDASMQKTEIKTEPKAEPKETD